MTPQKLSWWEDAIAPLIKSNGKFDGKELHDAISSLLRSQRQELLDRIREACGPERKVYEKYEDAPSKDAQLMAIGMNDMRRRILSLLNEESK